MNRKPIYIPTLTICQPWASAIIAGLKPFENRKWTRPYRGRLLIHAGKSLDWMKEAYSTPQIAQALESLGDPHKLPLGRIIGLVDLVDIAEYGPQHIGDPMACGPFCWELRNPMPALNRIECKGQLGLWSYNLTQLGDPFIKAE